MFNKIKDYDISVFKVFYTLFLFIVTFYFYGSFVVSTDFLISLVQQLFLMFGILLVVLSPILSSVKDRNDINGFKLFTPTLYYLTSHSFILWLIGESGEAVKDWVLANQEAAIAVAITVSLMLAMSWTITLIIFLRSFYRVRPFIADKNLGTASWIKK